MWHDIRVLHLEPTDVCQARCLLCARETNPNFDPRDRHHLCMDQILSVFDAQHISSLHKMFMCGNYGDPAAGRHTLDIYRAFREINPNIVLGMNTNGGLQNSAWWQALGKIMSHAKDYVVFSIDGLEDTNGIYRVDVDWRRVMENTRAFIGSGGTAHWDMLVYDHNQHQVDQAQSLAQQMGFSWFRAKVSKRPLRYTLAYPAGWQRPQVDFGPIDCHALREKSVYLDARGRLHACCWLGDDLNSDPADFVEIQKTWLTERPNLTCQKTCASKNNGTSFINQWQRNVALK